MGDVLQQSSEVVFADEVGLGLLGQVRRRWVARGVELRYEWRYLLVDAEPVTGRLWWAWLERVQGKEVAKVMEKWKAVGAVGVKRIYQPPYLPEVSPVEGLRRWVEGKVWGSIEAKQAAVETV